MCVFILLLAVAIAPQSTDDQDIIKWEDEIANLEKADQTDPHVENAILYCGSSSIRLWNTIEEDMAPWPAIQRGYGGAKLPDVIHYAPRLIGPRLGIDNPKRCKAIVLFVANDISGNKENDASPTEVGLRFARLHRWIRQQDRTISVFWIEVTPTNKRWEVWPEIQAATQQIRNVLDPDPYGYFIPTAGAYLGNDGRPRAELFVDDQLHLNKDGYKLWASLIKTHLHQKLGAVVPQIVEPAKH
jgi:hypothetical protein